MKHQQGHQPLATEIIAHRGASFDAPENTLASVQLGWAQEADAVEIDIRFSRDDRIVVIHDDDTRRIGGLPRAVRDQSFEELRHLDAGEWKGPQWRGQRYPSLDEVLATIPAGKRLFVEVKCGPEFLDAFEACVLRSGKDPRQIVPIGFAASTMQLVKAALPQLEVCLVADFEPHAAGGAPSLAEELIACARAAGLDGLDVDGYGPIDGTFVGTVKRAGLKLYVWTVDSPERARELIAAGIDGITTNRPGWLRTQLGACPS